MKTARRLALLAWALMAPIGAAQAADVVVVESTAPELPAGQVIKAGTPIRIPAGARIAVVGEDGKVVKLAGPFSGVAAPATAAASDKGTVQALSRLFADKGPAATSWGTFRGDIASDDTAGTPPEVWAVNIMRSETVCLPAGTRPMIWRPDASQPMSAILLQLSSGREGSIALDAGQQSLPWPSAPEIVDGGEYAIRETGGNGVRRLFVRLIPASQESGVPQVAWMSDAGCLRQAKTLLAQVAG